MPPPQNVNELRAYLGTANYSVRFIQNFASPTTPLRELAKKGTKWEWSKTEQDTFETVKESLSADTVMTYYEIGRATEVIIDGNPLGLGAIVAQKKSEEEGFKVGTYVSSALALVEKQYKSQIEWEAPALKWACERLKSYVTGAKFKIVTDHEPLVAIFNKPSSKPPPRIEKWVLFLQSYDFTVEYRPGKDNTNDYPSRHPLEYNDEEMTSSQTTEEQVTFVMNSSIPGAVTRDTELDPVLQKIIAVIQSGKLREFHKDPDLKPYKLIATEMSITDGVILHGNKIVVPQSEQPQIIKLSHEGHQGIVCCKQYVRSKVWFPGIDKIIEDEIKNSIACQAVTSIRSREPLMIELIEEPWQKLSVDFCGPFPCGTHCMLFVDNYSRYPAVEFVTSTSEPATIPKFEKVFAQFGIPEETKSDNGSPFQSEKFRSYAERTGFHHRKVTPRHPEANGQAERFVPTVEKANETYVVEGKNWKKELDHFLRVYRSTPHATTVKSPHELLFGRLMRTKLPEMSVRRDGDFSVYLRDTAVKKKMKQHADIRTHAKPCQISMF